MVRIMGRRDWSCVVRVLGAWKVRTRVRRRQRAWGLGWQVSGRMGEVPEATVVCGDSCVPCLHAFSPVFVDAAFVEAFAEMAIRVRSCVDRGV